jgi:hypothetical protein
VACVGTARGEANGRGPRPCQRGARHGLVRHHQDVLPVPRTGAQAHAVTDDELTRLIPIWLVNRGIWDAFPGAGPTVPVPATPANVTRYLEAYSGLSARLR